MLSRCLLRTSLKTNRCQNVFLLPKETFPLAATSRRTNVFLYSTSTRRLTIFSRHPFVRRDFTFCSCLNFHTSLAIGYCSKTRKDYNDASNSQTDDKSQHFRSSNDDEDDDDKKRRSDSFVAYITGTVFLFVGLTYVAVPAYRLFCQSTSLGGAVKGPHLTGSDEKIGTMKTVKDRLIKISFESSVGASMPWEFKPQQKDIWVHPGETALVFYTATNPTDKPIVGISTYNVVPYDAGQYFSKIQCFCFEEQMLNPNEELDMPVFFYIDPDYANDPKLELTDEIVLSYTFFESKQGLKLPRPGFLQNDWGSSKSREDELAAAVVVQKTSDIVRPASL